jgi:choline dehydrogenase-like flavoprotein
LNRINDKQGPSDQYDAIVIGTGISGGWAAKELTEKGLKTLVLERGRAVKHVVDYPTMNKDPWDFPDRNSTTQETIKEQPKQARTGYTVREASRHWFVKDNEHPYNEIKRFDWMRGNHVGGRSITWGRQSYRLSPMDFEANKQDGYGVDWPIRYEDLAPWYSYVERHIGVSGQNEGLPQLPDGEFTPPMEFNCVEQHLKTSLESNFNDRMLTIGRTANITGDKSLEHRGPCQFRNRCIRGCPYGAYFSSLSSTLPHAEATGNMTLRPDSIVHSIMYDPKSGKATGVKVIDSNTKEELEFYAKIIFLNASAIASSAILLQSKSDRFPDGLGNDSGELGHNLMDHHLDVGAYGKFDGFQDKYHKGRRPNGIYIPRFRNLGDEHSKRDYVRGFGYQGGASRGNWRSSVKELSFGEDLKEDLMTPGDWRMGLGGFGECLPYHENRMFLDYEQLDQWGLPTVTFDSDYKENEKLMRVDMMHSAAEMLDKAGFEDIVEYDQDIGMGLGIHEMGTARMGRDPKTSVLNAFNQVHTAPNVFVTDGAAMTSA